ncbi:kinase-like protein [Phanerochaete sordida]|uniref:mitogen-activated protein kinase kinase n=1 Tax=Phanerochaete sordida TaxID=48140 RepID=A0A9P3GC43_9APHY|nr:kinase-like protein [Phanerochaete sordida]
MHSMHHANPPRPMGPRTQRAASPAPGYHPPDVAPLNVRKPSSVNLRDAALAAGSPHSSHSSLLAPTPPGGDPSPRPSRPSLALPGQSSGSRPKLKLPKLDFHAGEGPFVGGYAGGPNNANGSYSPQVNGSGALSAAESEPTIRPQQTISPQPRPPPVVSMENLRQTVEEFDQYSDDVLEELARLGEGAGGAVYKVRDKRTGAIMARKTITTLEVPIKQLLREIKIISSTSHVNIIKFYGAYMSSSSSEVKVLMEYGEGGSLESVGKQMKLIGGRVSEKVAGRLAEGILQGLAYLHSQKTIHRDIKPPNVLLTREGIVRLCDFGVSGELINSNAGTFTGTSLYMAPERLAGDQYSIRSDVWSTGITLLELVQNRFPFPQDIAQIELMMLITQNEPPELEDEDGIVYSPEMKDFIKAALTRQPDQRPTPSQLLTHPWIVKIMQQEVNMAFWLRKVWGWKKEKRADDSRPSSSRGPQASIETAMAGLRVNADSPPFEES